MTDLLNHRYRILQTVGAGGFGQTFLAEDTQLPSKRRCVIKQLKPISDRPELYQLIKARFEREATILEALGEGNEQIPRLYAYFETNNLFYLVQEWIDGATLALAMPPGQTSETAVQALLMSLLPVLEYIHSKGIIHRDIKPENIILRRSNQQPVLIDFGAVKETVRTELNSQGQPTRSIVIGTPGYMSSEQAMGKPVFSSDLYSLGLTAIYLLTGRSPYELETDSHTGEYIWQGFAPSIHPEFAAVLDRSIQSHRRDRFATAKEMKLALEKMALQSVQVVSPHAVTQPPQTVAQPNAIPPTQSPASPEPPTIATSARPSQPPVSHPTESPSTGVPRNTILLSSLIAGGLIGASVIVATVVSRSPQANPPTAAADEMIPIPTPISEEAIANSTPEESTAIEDANENPPVDSPATASSPIIPSPMAPQPSIPQPPVPQPSIPEVVAPSNSSSAQSSEFAWLSTRSVTEADLVGKTAFELDILRNAIFAQHGRRFNDEALQAYFNSRPWYQPRYTPDQFPNGLLSELERSNAQFILQYQDQTGLK
jgi:serine/threonine-protein kinase